MLTRCLCSRRSHLIIAGWQNQRGIIRSVVKALPFLKQDGSGFGLVCFELGRLREDAIKGIFADHPRILRKIIFDDPFDKSGIIFDEILDFAPLLLAKIDRHLIIDPT